MIIVDIRLRKKVITETFKYRYTTKNRMQQESDIKRFERLCNSAGININAITFIAKPDELYKLYKVIVKDCEKDNTSIIKSVEKPTITADKHKFGIILTNVDKQTITFKFKYKNSASITIEKSRVNLMLNIIRYLTNNGKNKTNYREIVKELKARKIIKTSISSFNGAKQHEYRYIYHYPLKVLQHYDFIDYNRSSSKILLLETKKQTINSFCKTLTDS